MREVRAFQDALIVHNVLARVAAEEHEAMEFPSEEARNKYLEKHPKADKSRHTVKDPKKAEPESTATHGDAAYQKSEAYKTKKDPDYYPEKEPSHLQEPPDVKSILSKFSGEQNSWMKNFPQEDLDKNEAYEHPKLKKVVKQLLQEVTKGRTQVSDLRKEMEKIQDLKDELSQKMRGATSDEKADEYRFPMRRLYKLWQCYNDASQKASRPDLHSGPWHKGPASKPGVPAQPHQAPKLPEHVIDKDVNSDTYHNEPEYKTKRNRSYHPDKAPPGWKLPSSIASRLSDVQKKQLDTMPEEDLDKEESYAHPAVKAITKHVIDKVKADPSSREALSKEMQSIEKLKFDAMETYSNAKNDEECDKYRFAMRKLNQLWRGYNAAFGELNHSAKSAADRVAARWCRA